MNGELDWEDGNLSGMHSSPGGAPGASRGYQNLAHPPAVETPKPAKTSDGDAHKTQGGAMADGSKSAAQPATETLWPPPGDAVFTTDDARIYLYKHHDMFVKERYMQKLVKDYKKLVGKRVSKKGGGSVVEITQSSLDKYAADNPTLKNAAEIKLERDDKLFEELHSVAMTKPYQVAIEGVAQVKVETPTKTPPPAQPPTEPAPEHQDAENSLVTNKTPGVEGEAPSKTPPPAQVPDITTFLYDQLNKFTKMFNAAQEKNEALDTAREIERTNYEAKLEKQRAEHAKEKDELLTDMLQIVDKAASLKASNIKLKSAFHEAISKLPPGTTLSTAAIDDLDNPDQIELIPPKYQPPTQTSDISFKIN